MSSRAVIVRSALAPATPGGVTSKAGGLSSSCHPLQRLASPVDLPVLWGGPAVLSCSRPRRSLDSSKNDADARHRVEVRMFSTTAATPTPQISSPSSFFATSGRTLVGKTHTQPCQIMDLGNNITVEVAIPGKRPFSSARSGQRRMQVRGAGNRQRPEKSGRSRGHRHAEEMINDGIPLFTADGGTAEVVESARGEKQQKSGKAMFFASPPHAKATEPVATQQQHASTVGEDSDELPLPRTADEAASLLECSTLFEALTSPSSALLTPLPSRNVAPPSSLSLDLKLVKENVHHLQVMALPTMFQVVRSLHLNVPSVVEREADVAESQHAQSDRVLIFDNVPGSPEVVASLTCLSTHLQYMAAATRTDGRRHVSALPPAVTVALWEMIMPSLHALLYRNAAGKARLYDEDAGGAATIGEHIDSDGKGPEKGGGVPAANAYVRTTAEQGLKNLDGAYQHLLSGSAAALTGKGTAAASAFPTLKSVYISLRRALALHTRAVASLLPPSAFALVLTRMYQCGALADDVLGSVLAERLECLERKEDRHTTGGSIATLRERVLRLPGSLNMTDAPMDSLTAALPVDAVPITFRGASAVTMARLLGRAAIPGHHQIHRFFHLALLPELTVLLSDAVEKLVTVHASSQQGATDEVEGSFMLRRGAVFRMEAAGTTALVPGGPALLDLTAAFRHYAVSGRAVVYLTQLWKAHFAASQQQREETDVLATCTKLLTAMTAMPTASSRTQRRSDRRIRRIGTRSSSAKSQRDQLLNVTEPEYYPLVEEVCKQIHHLCLRIAESPSVTEESTRPPKQNVTVTSLLWLMRLLLRVNGPHWAETYEMLATTILARLTRSANSTFDATAVAAASAVEELALEHLLPVAMAHRTLTALLHRNSLIPDHPLHRVLLRRLLYSAAALKDPAVTSTVLLGLELMVPPEEGAPFPTEEGSHSTHKAGVTAASSAGLPAIATTSAAPVTITSSLAVVSGASITTEDRVRALHVFRRLGRSITPTAFVAGLCAVPLNMLPYVSQVAIVNHLTAVASAVAPSFLVKGMEAVVRKLDPSVVDDLSVQRWFSRFTARDVVRRVDVIGCAVLLDLLSQNPNYERNCALAKQSITRRIGVALRRSGDGDDSSSYLELGRTVDSYGQKDAISMEALPRVVSALQRANVFLPPYYSRVCRLLLGQVETAALSDLLPPFAVTAGAYMARQRSEAQASLFKDVWELLRGRLMDQVGQLTLSETITALNAFATLDVTDRALFSVLVYQLWCCIHKEEEALSMRVADGAAMAAPLTMKDEGKVSATPTIWHHEVSLGASPSVHHLSKKSKDEPETATTVTATSVHRPLHDSNEAIEAALHRRVQIGEYVTRILSPSALAVVITTLISRDESEVPHAASSSFLEAPLEARHGISRPTSRTCAGEVKGETTGGDDDTPVRMLLPWMLVAICRCCTELYPVDVVHLMPALLRYHTLAAPLLAAEREKSAKGSFADLNASLLHAAYDACRSAFLFMYADISSTSHSELTITEQQRIAEQRAQWSPATKLSVDVVPRQWFVAILLSLSGAALTDIAVADVCVRRACTRRICGDVLPASQLVDVCLSLCWLRDSTPDAVGDGTNQGEPADPREAGPVLSNMHDAVKNSLSALPIDTAPTNSREVMQAAMATVLSALWRRTDELSIAQIDALLRCLYSTFGANRVDSDFVERLEAQKKLLLARAATATKRDSKEVVPSSSLTVLEGDDSTNLHSAAVRLGKDGTSATVREVPDEVHVTSAPAFPTPGVTVRQPASLSREGLNTAGEPEPRNVPSMSADDLFSPL